MLFTSLIIAGSTLYVGKKTLSKLQAKKPSSTVDQLTQKQHKQTNNFSQVFKRLQKHNPFADKHGQILQDLANQKTFSSETDLVEQTCSDAEKKMDQLVSLSLVSLGITTAGSLLYAPLTLAALPILVYLSIPIYQDAYHALIKEKRVRIAVVDSIIITLAFIVGQALAVSLTYTLLFLSKKLLHKTEDRSQQSTIDLFDIQQTSVWRVANGIEIETALEEIKKGDVIVIHAGESIPVDGIIVEGEASIDQHILTGEAQPVEKGIEEKVFASTMILTGRISVKVETTGQETSVAQIGQILTNTADYKMVLRSRGEKVVDSLALPILVFGTASFIFLGPMTGLAATAACMSLDVRVVAPLVMLAYLNLTVREGVLIKDGRVLDLLNKVDTIVFDKTGTLTLAKPHVTDIHVCVEKYCTNDILMYAAAAEYKQPHPIALAILEEADKHELTLPTIEQTEIKVGFGISVRINNDQAENSISQHQRVRVGSERFMVMEGIAIPDHIQTLKADCHEKGVSLIMVAIDNHLVGAIELHATLRPETPEVIKGLREHFSSMYIISGDHENPTKKLANTLGIEHYYAETLPEQKAEIIEALQAKGKSVCYIGDGINDSIALKTADVSISLRGASTIATDTAQIILMHEKLSQLQTLFKLAGHYKRDMDRTLLTKMSPALIGIPGVLLLHFNLMTAILLNNAGVLAGISSAMLPSFKSETPDDKKED